MLYDIEGNWVVEEAEQVDIEIHDCVGQKLDASIGEVSVEDTEEDAKDEHKVDDLTENEGNFTGFASGVLE